MTAPRPEDIAPDSEELLVAEQVAEYFKVSKRTALGWCKANKFPSAFMLGGPGGWRIPRSDVIAFRNQLSEERAIQMAKKRGHQ